MKGSNKPVFFQLVVLFTLFTLLFTSCAKDENEITYADYLIDPSLCVEEFSYINIGAYWRYGSDFKNGKKYDGFDSVLTMQIIKLDTLDLYRVLCISGDTAGLRDTSYTQILEKDSGYFQYGVDSKHHPKLFPGIFLNPNNLQPKSSVKDKFFDDLPVGTTLHKNNHKVEVPAGYFTTNVYKVNYTNSSNFFFVYYTPCIGIVKVEEFDLENDRLNEIYLVEHSPN